MIRVKVRTNRYLNLFVSIDKNKKIEQLSDRILQCVHQLGEQNASQPPKDQNMVVLALNFQGFFISKHENVGSILKDGDEIECTFSGARMKSSGSGSWKSSNKWEGKQSNNFKNMNTSESSTDHHDLNNRGLDSEKKLSKRERKKMKYMSKEKQRKQFIIKEQARSHCVKNSQTNDLNPFAMGKTENKEKRSMQVEQTNKKIINIPFSEKYENSKQKNEIQQQYSQQKGSKKDVNFESKNQGKELENLKAIKNEKKTVKIPNLPNPNSKKKQNGQGSNSNKQSEFKIQGPSKQSLSVKQQNLIQHNIGNEMIELSTQMNLQTLNNIKKASDNWVKLQHRGKFEKQRELGEELVTKELPKIQEMTENNISSETEKNDMEEKGENGDKKKLKKKSEKLASNEKKFEGIVYCFKKQKQNEETSKTFTETESEANLFDLPSRNGETVSGSKQVAFKPKGDVLAALKAKYSKLIIGNEQKL